MRTVLAVAIASLSLAGCGSMDFFGDSITPPPQTAPASSTQTMSSNAAAPADPAAIPSPSTSSPATSTAQAAASSKTHCTALAKQRATDVAFQGEDSDTQESVYNRTYSDCVTWDLKHNVY